MRFILTLVVLSLTQISCGYTTKSSLPGNLKAIYVAPFDNNVNYSTEHERNVYFPLIEVKARDEVINRFQFDGNLKIAEEDEADLILTGKLLNYDRVPLRYTNGDVVEEYRIKVIMSLELWDVEKQEMMWVETRFVGDDTYFPIGPLATTEDAAVEGAVEDLARRIVERTIENW